MNKKDYYTLKESGITYFFSLVAILSLSIFLSLLVGTISSSTGVDVKEVQKYSSVYYINMLLSGIIFLFVFLGINLKFKKNFLHASKLKTKFNFLLALIAILLAIVVFLGGLNITGLYNHLFAHIFPQQTSGTIVTQNFGIFVIQVLLLAFFPAVFEELVFRGIIYNGLRQKYSAGVSIVISSLFFMLMHLSIYKSFYQIILGLVLGLLIHFTGSVIYGMIFHFTNNFIIILLNYISPNGSVFELVKKGELLSAVWGIKEILLSILFFVIGIALVTLIFYLTKKYTYKHKNYLNLETTNEPLNFEKENDISIIGKNKIKINNNSSGHIMWFALSISGFVLFWIMSSCGVL